MDLDATVAWPARRFPHLVGIVPGARRLPVRPRILVAIDTSASITRPELERIAAELDRLARNNEVYVIECDVVITAEYKFQRRIRSVRGGGGTDLRPPFASAVLRARRPDVIVYFTDGEGPAPERAPRIPVIWCVTHEGVRPAPWGALIQMAPSQ